MAPRHSLASSHLDCKRGWVACQREGQRVGVCGRSCRQREQGSGGGGSQPPSQLRGQRLRLLLAIPKPRLWGCREGDDAGFQQALPPVNTAGFRACKPRQPACSPKRSPLRRCRRRALGAGAGRTAACPGRAVRQLVDHCCMICEGSGCGHFKSSPLRELQAHMSIAHALFVMHSPARPFLWPCMSCARISPAVDHGRSSQAPQRRGGACTRPGRTAWL